MCFVTSGGQAEIGIPGCSSHSYGEAQLDGKVSSAGARALRRSEKTEVARLTTIVVTRARGALLNRALRSLEAQKSVRIELVVVVDDCPLTCRFLETLHVPMGAVQSVQWTNVERDVCVRSGPKRLATLRNRGLEMVATRWCTYLDDDNELEPQHLSTLLECVMRSGSSAAHSWRSLWTRDVRPFYLRDRHPWCRDPELAKRLFAQYRDAGIYQSGSNIVRDQVVPFCRHVSMVDMSEWLFKTEFICGIRFVENYCTEDRETSWAEDAKLLDEIVARGLRIPSTQKSTLRYYMGGYSNDWTNNNGWL